ncbi:MAG TPA: hypothetical protein VKS78_04490 [Roseiarcus sp.]|nr:hypothetical protein [Roseiarcus sp.]
MDPHAPDLSQLPIIAISSALSALASALGTIFAANQRHRIEREKTRQDERSRQELYFSTNFENLVESYRRQADDYAGRMLALESGYKAKIEALELKMAAMQQKMEALEALVYEEPFFKWSISLEGQYLYCNSKMRSELLHDRPSDWIYGKRHGDIWPNKAVELFESLDERVRSRSPRVAIVTGVDLLDDGDFYTVIKWGQFDPLRGVVTVYHGQAIKATVERGRAG